MSDRPDVFTDSAGATHTAHDCRWITSSIYAGFDACLVNPVAHYRESGAEARATAPLDVERPMPFVGRVSPPFTNRDQELAQAFREAVAQAHYQATNHPVYPHPLVEDDDYNCPNEWCQRMWAMVREAEDRARLTTTDEGAGE